MLNHTHLKSKQRGQSLSLAEPQYVAWKIFHRLSRRQRLGCCTRLPTPAHSVPVTGAFHVELQTVGVGLVSRGGSPHVPSRRPCRHFHDDGGGGGKWLLMCMSNAYAHVDAYIDKYICTQTTMCPGSYSRVRNSTNESRCVFVSSFCYLCFAARSGLNSPFLGGLCNSALHVHKNNRTLTGRPMWSGYRDIFGTKLFLPTISCYSMKIFNKQ